MFKQRSWALKNSDRVEERSSPVPHSKSGFTSMKALQISASFLIALPFLIVLYAFPADRFLVWRAFGAIGSNWLSSDVVMDLVESFVPYLSNGQKKLEQDKDQRMIYLISPTRRKINYRRAYSYWFRQKIFA